MTEEGYAKTLSAITVNQKERDEAWEFVQTHDFRFCGGAR